MQPSDSKTDLPTTVESLLERTLQGVKAIGWLFSRDQTRRHVGHTVGPNVA